MLTYNCEAKLVLLPQQSTTRKKQAVKLRKEIEEIFENVQI